jgi:hypothetical protein
LVITLASPTTAFLIAPDGNHAGVDPTTGTLTFDFQMAISEAGDEPYFMVVPNPMEGEHVLQVIGTNSGPYLLTVYALDENGNSNEPVSVSGRTEAGHITEYKIEHENGQTHTGLKLVVAIDVKPGSFPNSLNLRSKGKVPVAILSTGLFDAPSELNKSSLSFGRTGDEESLAFCNESGEDVNGDGLLDLVCHFRTQLTGFQIGDAEGILRGTTIDGVNIEGRDSVEFVK